jgi:hypothetical protein
MPAAEVRRSNTVSTRLCRLPRPLILRALAKHPFTHIERHLEAA